ncbi:MAG: hypothetical protein IK131_10735 [Paludibacteraceae bacterium]|nr:hypothetical protein [Paludibacteraceae bacterium]
MAVMKSPMDALIAAAKENEKREREKALQDNVNAPEPKSTTGDAQKKNQDSASAPTSGKSSSSKSASDDALSANFSKLLVKCGKENAVVVQIPARIHQEIKLISYLSGTPINSIVSNMLEDSLARNEKEIAKLKSKIK